VLSLRVVAVRQVGGTAFRVRLARWTLVALLPALFLIAAPVGGAGTIAVENSLPGTKAWYPLYNNGPAGAIEGYTSQVSYQAGETLQFHVSTNPAASYRIVIYRLGYYQGLGGRQLACLPSCSGSSSGVPQPVPAPDQYGRVAAGWPVTDSITVPSSWVSGFYVAKLVLTGGANTGKSAPVSFVIKSTALAPMLIVSAVNTEQAYNSWGGKSLYTFNSTGGVAAVKVSFDRPTTGNAYFFEQPFVLWFEKQGIDASYTTDVDVDTNPSQLLGERFVMVYGHSEYWSRGDRDAYEAARAAGVNLAFWGGDIGTWQVRYEDAGRTLVGYKLNTGDPYAGTLDWTNSFQRIGRPECQIIGTAFTGGHGYIPSYSFDQTAINDPWFAGAGVTAGMTVVANNFEYDSQAPAGCLPVPSTTLFYWSGAPQWAPAVRYQWPSGSTVFGVGSFALSMVGSTSPQMQQIALNAITSLDSSTQAAAPPVGTHPPVILGTAVQGQSLTVTPGTWTGIPVPTLAEQWLRCDTNGANCVPIIGATGNSYLLGVLDIGSTIEVAETATNSSGAVKTASSPTAVVASITPPLNTQGPIIIGTTAQGQTLTGSQGTWVGTPPPTLTNEWDRCDISGNNCVAINGQTGLSYVLAQADVGSTIRFIVTGTNVAGSLTVSSAQTGVVAASGGIGPTTPVLDTFNRANGGAGANWSLLRPTGFAGMNVSVNAAVDSSTSVFAANYWNPASFGPDVEAYATVASWGASDTIRVGARVQNAGTTSASGYYVQIGNTGVWSILRVDAGPSTTLATGPTQPLLNGDKIMIRITGTVISALRFTGGNWAVVMSYDTASDATKYTTAGRVVIQFKTSTIDDLGGGTI
jgi:hypothetical protein